MWFSAVVPVALAAAVSAATPVFAQDWAPMTSKEDGFRAAYPGQPSVETIGYTTEFRLTLPARVYRASDPLGRYSTTVVDYRDVERLHNERAAACRAAKGANQKDGDTCQNDFVLEVVGAMDHAMSGYLRRDGVKITHYGTYFVEQVSGRLLHLSNAGSVAHQCRRAPAWRPPLHPGSHRARGHAGTDPVHGIARVGEPGRPGDPLSQPYTEGYADWKFPQPPPPFTLRDLDTSIDQPARPPR